MNNWILINIQSSQMYLGRAKIGVDCKDTYITLDEYSTRTFLEQHEWCRTSLIYLDHIVGLDDILFFGDTNHVSFQLWGNKFIFRSNGLDSLLDPIKILYRIISFAPIKYKLEEQANVFIEKVTQRLAISKASQMYRTKMIDILTKKFPTAQLLMGGKIDMHCNMHPVTVEIDDYCTFIVTVFYHPDVYGFGYNPCLLFHRINRDQDFDDYMSKTIEIIKTH
jgi:hypothetical protein